MQNLILQLFWKLYESISLAGEPEVARITLVLIAFTLSRIESRCLTSAELSDRITSCPEISVQIAEVAKVMVPTEAA